MQLFSTVSVQYAPTWSKGMVALLRKVSPPPLHPKDGPHTRGAWPRFPRHPPPALGPGSVVALGPQLRKAGLVPGVMCLSSSSSCPSQQAQGHAPWAKALAPCLSDPHGEPGCQGHCHHTRFTC